MKFLNISFISLLYPYPIKEYNSRSKKPILEVLIFYFKVNKY